MPARSTRDVPHVAAVLWDMDGTLLDPNGSIRTAIDAAVAHGGHEPFAPEEVLVGMPLREILQKRTQDVAAIEAMVDEFRRVSDQVTWRMVRWYPGILDALSWCRQAGLATGVVTTKGQAEAETLLRRLGAAHHFDVVVGDDDVRPVKPDPAPVLAACHTLGVEPADAVVVGDTRYDVEAGRAAGCTTVGVAWGHGAGAHGPQDAHHHVGSPDALIPVLRRLTGRHNP